MQTKLWHKNTTQRLCCILAPVGEVFQYTVDQTNHKATFSIYDGQKLYNQVVANGHITDKNAAYLRSVTLSY